jgi:hypothetical protein
MPRKLAKTMRIFVEIGHIKNRGVRFTMATLQGTQGSFQMVVGRNVEIEENDWVCCSGSDIFRVATGVDSACE